MTCNAEPQRTPETKAAAGKPWARGLACVRLPRSSSPASRTAPPRRGLGPPGARSRSCPPPRRIAFLLKAKKKQQQAGAEEGGRTPSLTL